MRPSIGEGIALKRKEAGYTQAQVAELLGMHKETVSRLETGAIMPTVQRLVQLSELFQCRIGDFFYGDTDAIEAKLKQMAARILQLPEKKREKFFALIFDLCDLAME